MYENLSRSELEPQNNWMSGISQLELLIKDGQSMIRIQFKRSIMKMKFENQRHKA